MGVVVALKVRGTAGHGLETGTANNNPVARGAKGRRGAVELLFFRCMPDSVWRDIKLKTAANEKQPKTPQCVREEKLG